MLDIEWCGTLPNNVIVVKDLTKEMTIVEFVQNIILNN